MTHSDKFKTLVSIHSRLKAADGNFRKFIDIAMVSIHSRLKAAGIFLDCNRFPSRVSIHSRLKAAAIPSKLL